LFNSYKLLYRIRGRFKIPTVEEGGLSLEINGRIGGCYNMVRTNRGNRNEII